MDAFGASELRRLTAEQTGPCVSVYLPTHATGQEGQQDVVRLKNLLQRSEEQLANGWMRPADARKLLQQARDLATDPGFWDQRSEGLAIFVASAVFCGYRLPLAFDAMAIVNRRFHVKQLLPLVTGGDRFFILTLSQNKVRLFAASRHGIEPVHVDGLPANMRDALNYAEADRGSQVHSAMRGRLGKQAAVFHGHGGQPDTRKDDLAQFFRFIDGKLQPILREERAPLLLAGVEYLLPIYRDASSYPHVAEQELTGNCDYLTGHQLHQKAWPLMEPVFQLKREDAVARYHRLACTGKTSDDVREIIAAAREGRIDTLMLDLQASQWGLYDAETGAIELHDRCQAGDDDLVDLAAAQTLLRGGTVYSAQPYQMPGQASLAAILRY